MPPSLCPFVYIAVVCDLRNGTNMAVYLALLLVHNHINGITSNIYCEFHSIQSCNYFTTFISVPISTVLAVTVLVLTEQELLLMV